MAGLADKYDEAVQSFGLDTKGNLLEIFASSSGTWSAVLTSPRGLACIVAFGEDWELIGQSPDEISRLEKRSLPASARTDTVKPTL